MSRNFPPGSLSSPFVGGFPRWLLLVALAVIGCATATTAALRDPPPPSLHEARVLAAFDPEAQVEGGPPFSVETPLEVLDTTPNGRSAGEPIRLRFNRAVARPGALPDVDLVVERQRANGRWANVAGESRWSRPDRIEFVPAEALPDAHRFRVRLEGAVPDQMGGQLRGVRWEFETWRPTLELVELWDELGPADAVEIWVDQPTTAAGLQSHLRVADAAGRSVPARVRIAGAEVRDDRSWEAPTPSATLVQVLPARTWPLGTVLKFSVDAKFRSRGAALPIGRGWSTRVSTRASFRVLGLQCPERRGDRCPLGPIVIRTTNAMELDGIRVVPEPAELSISEHVTYDDDDDEITTEGIEIDAAFEPGRRYEIVLPRGARDVHEQRLVGSRRVAVQFTEVLARGEATLSMSSTRGIHATVEDARIGILAHRVLEAEIRVAVLDPAAAVPWLLAEDLDDRPWPAGGDQTTLTRTLAAGSSNRWVRVPLPLAPFARAGDTVLVEVMPKKFAPRTTGERPGPMRGLYRISGLGVFAHSGPARGVVRVTDLATSRPRAGIEVTLHAGKKRRRLGLTDADGMLALPGAIDVPKAAAIVARDPKRGDALPVRLSTYAWTRHDGLVTARRPIPQLRYGHPDRAQPDRPLPKPLRRGERGLVAAAVGRGVYMPGDLVQLAGWAAIATPYGPHNTRRIPKGTRVELAVRIDDDEIAKAIVRVNEHGRFAHTLRLPEHARLGRYTLESTMLESTHATWFDVAEPRIPAFELAAAPRVGRVRRGEPIDVDVSARYLSGERTPLLGLTWTVDCAAATPDLTLPLDYSARTDAPLLGWSERKQIDAGERSRIHFAVPTDALDHRAGRACHIAVAGQDASEQIVGADTWAFVHPGPGYLAVAVPFVEAGQRAKIRVIAVDHDSHRIAADSLTLTIARRIGDERVDVLHSCKTSVAATGLAASCRTPKLKEGRHRVRVTGLVDGAPLEIDRNLYVFAPREPEIEPPPAPPPPAPALVVDAPDEVVAGKPAVVAIRSRWKRAQGILTIEQTGLRRALPFALRGGKASVSVVPLPGAGPRLELSAHVTRPAEDHALARIESAEDTSTVRDRQALEVEIDAPQRARPGEQKQIRIKVTDPAGDPVAARVALWVIDDGLHQLRAPARPQLETIFNPDRWEERALTDTHRDLLEPFDPSLWARRGFRAPRVRQASGSVKGGFDAEIRRRFDPQPLFVGDIGTGPDGAVAIPLRLPDDLTRFRITAIASAELTAAATTGPARFGWGDAAIEVTSPLPVRAATPRVLRPGDRAEVAALVTARETGSLAVSAVVASKRGALVLSGPAERTRRVNRGEVVRVPFSIRARAHGRGAVRFVASLQPDRAGAKPIAGGVEQPLAVEVERTAIERAAIYGTVASDRPVALPLRLPAHAKGNAARVEVAVTTTVIGELDDAADYLVRYPYGCVEQTASRLVPLLALQGLGAQLPDDLPSPDVLVAETLARLAGMQHEGGTFGYWPGDPDPSYMPGAYATWVLLLAKEAGLAVPKTMLTRALAALRTRATVELPAGSWSQQAMLIERAFVVRALAQTGEVPAGAFEPLWEDRERLPRFARLLLLQALHAVDPTDARVDTLVADLSAAIEERPSAAHVVDPEDTNGRWSFWLSSPLRTDALALQTLLQVRPDDPRIDKLARGLRERRRGGRWRNTQENAFALLALSTYAQQRESERPEQRVQAWIGRRRVVDAEVHGFDSTRRGGAVGLDTALADADDDRVTHVVVERTGRGRAYYRVGVEWTPRHAPARAQGLTLQRQLVGVDESGAVAGERYVVEVELGSDTPMHFVAVEIPLPAGLEAIDVGLGKGARARSVPGAHRSPILSHEELRPDRVVLFFDELPAGETTHAIPVVATTPGDYTLPAAVAEAMYEPEVRARTTATRLIVKD